MTILTHISDLHFGRENIQLIAGLKRVLDDLQPQLILISGDLTQRARTAEYRAARSFLNELQWPYLVISGNHDISAHNLIERFFSPWKKWHSYLDRPLEPTIRTTDCIAMGINTTRRLGSLFDWSRGRISPEQISSIEECFQGSDDKKLRLIAAHHPFWLPEAYRHRQLIGRRDAALRTMQKVGIDIVLSGHVHFGYTHLLEGIIISHAGTAISNRLTANNRNSFKIINGNRKKLAIETWEWNNTCFAVEEVLVFHRDQEKWRQNWEYNPPPPPVPRER